MNGCLWLIPVPLSTQASLGSFLLAPDVPTVQGLNYFVVENAKTARAFLKTLPLTKILQDLSIGTLNKHAPAKDLDALLAPLLAGKDIGLMSEAGCPAVADAGAQAVAWAHAHQCRVAPLVGPSSLMLALMASGLNGQAFAFNGYLPVPPAERKASLQRFELRSAQEQQTQLFIETPYRTKAWLTDALTHLQPSTQLSIACDLSLSGQFCQTRTISDWNLPGVATKTTAQIDGRLVVFSYLAQGRA
jgi:16S rRNA (cytidine1402-2'-O)-methyltransferase